MVMSLWPRFFGPLGLGPMPSVLWRCWLGGRKGIRPVKTEWWGAGVVICLERGADLHKPSWCYCHSLSLASVKSRLVLPFWYRPTRVVLEKGPLNGCVCLFRSHSVLAFSALTLMFGWQEWHPACKKTEWWGAGMVICLERRCRLAYGPADATATHCLLLQ